jgi:hypothetical protein
MARIDHVIDFEKNSIIFYKFIYYFSEKELTVLKQYFTESEKKNWIRKFKILIKIPILFILKKDGSLRLYIDYRSLNKLTIKNKYALSLIKEFVNKLSDAAIYIKLNIKDIYYKIRIRFDNEWKIAFRTRYGHYEYIMIFFDLTNISATF